MGRKVRKQVRKRKYANIKEGIKEKATYITARDQKKKSHRRGSNIIKHRGNQFNSFFANKWLREYMLNFK